MSELNRRLHDPAVRWAFDCWRAAGNPNGTVDEFFRRRHSGGRKHRGHGHALRRALRRAADSTLPADVRERARQDAERIKRELAL